MAFVELAPSTSLSQLASSKMALQPEFKIILLGDPAVGKTTYFLRLKEGGFIDTEKRPTASLGVEHLEHVMTIGGVEVKVSRSIQRTG